MRHVIEGSASKLDTTSPPRYSVIVPARNAALTLGGCLSGLLDQSAPPDSYEVVVIDDGSTDNTSKVAEDFGARLIRQEHAGPASARNAGARAARGGILLFTDADCEPTRGWIAEITAPLETAPYAAGAKGSYLTRQVALVARFAQLELETKYAKLRKCDSVDFIDTYSAAIRTDAFWSVGGFDPRYPAASNEDTALSFALAERGQRLVFAEKAIVYHRHVETFVGYLERKFRHGYWRTRVYREHPKKMAGDSYTPRSTQVQLLAAASLPGAVALWALGGSPLLPLGVVLAFLAATAPFVGWALRKDVPVALVAPAILFARAVAIGLGLLSGAAPLLLERRAAVTGPGRRVRSPRTVASTTQIPLSRLAAEGHDGAKKVRN